jgi:hypothetical protein
MFSAVNNESVQGGILCDLTKVLYVVTMIRHCQNGIYIKKLAKLLNLSNRSLGIGAKMWS